MPGGGLNKSVLDLHGYFGGACGYVSVGNAILDLHVLLSLATTARVLGGGGGGHLGRVCVQLHITAPSRTAKKQWSSQSKPHRQPHPCRSSSWLFLHLPIVIVVNHSLSNSPRDDERRKRNVEKEPGYHKRRSKRKAQKIQPATPPGRIEPKP